MPQNQHDSRQTGWNFGLAVSVGFGIDRAEVTMDAATSGRADRLNRASYVALALFFVSEVTAALVLSRAHLGLWPRAHRAARFLALLAAGVVLSYAGMMMLAYSGAVPPIIARLFRRLSNLILGMTP